MNNKYYLFLSIILSLYIVLCGCPVFAQDSDLIISDFVDQNDLPSNQLDSYGHVVSGSFLAQREKLDFSDYYITTFDSNNDDVGYIYLTVQPASDFAKYQYDVYLVGSNTYSAYRKRFTDQEIEDSSDLHTMFINVSSDVDNAFNYPSHYNFVADDIVSNVPIFNYSDSTSIDDYINNGNISGALNKNDVIPPPEIPYPTNISLSKTSKQNYGDQYNNPIVVSWNAGSNANYNYQNMRFSVSYDAVYGYSKAGISNTVSSGVKNVAQHVKYQNENQTYTIGIDNLNENLTLTIAGLQVSVKSKWLNSITIYIQNEDDQNSSYVSSIKYIAYDFVTKVEDSSNPPIDDGSLGGGESDGNSSGVGDGSSGGSHSSGSVSLTNNNNPNITINNSNNLTGGATDNYITSAVQGALNGTSAMGSAIHNGFGILGENGFLSAMTSMFTFIPQDIITMITTTVAACCLMFIVGAVVWFIRG